MKILQQADHQIFIKVSIHRKIKEKIKIKQLGFWYTNNNASALSNF